MTTIGARNKPSFATTRTPTLEYARDNEMREVVKAAEKEADKLWKASLPRRTEQPLLEEVSPGAVWAGGSGCPEVPSSTIQSRRRSYRKSSRSSLPRGK